MDAVRRDGGEPVDPDAGDRPRRNRHTTRVFTVLLFASLYLLSRRWREKDRAAATAAALTPSEIAGAVSFLASILYLLPLLGDL
ncbi:3-hydroxy-3-methylglutaryl-coenzyme A reductase 1 [Canna indica]|uniref:3-hydroxy-3-methylglutaryl-coenzyme A reductase 1 n=1 Tax=Canna indica TaxID=4628 RepID=A0AAQ3QFD3_9LILI|nr:3-hydroxy-3-methylglutaryl-coenzyme A reductase 1 [Canna indica]